MTLWEKTKPTDIIVGFLDLGLLLFLIFDFGFKNLSELFHYKIIVLPLLLLALILNIIIIIRKKYHINLLGRSVEKREVVGLPKPDIVFQKGDVLAVFGKHSDIKKYLK